MGYSVNLFTDPQINEEFKCKICNDVLQEPTLMNPCEHAVCASCLQEWRTTSKVCPCDGRSIGKSKKPQRQFMTLLNSLELKCPFTSSGCDIVLPLGDLEEHDQKCSFNPENWKECQTGCGAIVNQFVRNSGTHSCVQHLKSQWQVTKDALVIAHQELSSTKEQLMKSEEKLKQTRSELTSKELELERTKADLKSKEKELDDEKMKLNSNQQELDSTKEKLNSKDKEIEETKIKMNSTEAKLQVANKNVTKLILSTDQQDKQLPTAKAELYASKEQREELQHLLNKEIEDTKTKMNCTKAKLQKTSESLKCWFLSNRQLEKQLLTVKAQLETTKEKEDKLQQQLNSKDKELGDTQLRLSSVQTHLQATQEKLESACQQFIEKQTELDSTKIELQNQLKSNEQNQQELECTKLKLDSAEAQLQTTKNKLESTAQQLFETKEELSSTKMELQKAGQKLLQHAKDQLKTVRKTFNCQRRSSNAAPAGAGGSSRPKIRRSAEMTVKVNNNHPKPALRGRVGLVKSRYNVKGIESCMVQFDGNEKIPIRSVYLLEIDASMEARVVEPTRVRYSLNSASGALVKVEPAE